MVKYNEVKETFEKHNCQLLMSEEEFNLKPRKVFEIYKYIASCQHNHEVNFHNFKGRSTGVFCPNCVYLKISKDNIEKYVLNPISTHDLEYDSIVYLKSIIGDTFDVNFNGEDCLSDCCIKPKYITEDKWIMVQMKSTSKPTSNYSFNRCSKYNNCIIMCICISDKKMWVFDGNKITISTISIGLTKSKQNEFEITRETIHEKITHYYNTFPKYDFETIDTPITIKFQLEREYRIIRETIINCLTFIRNERQGLVYDFIVNGLKVQEKVCSKKKNKNGIDFNLNKKNGVKQSISYKIGDNDFYWLNVNNKQHFYVIPENELLSRNYINTDTRASITLNPLSKTGKNSWANEYLFDYTNITKIDEEKLKRMFHIVV